MPLTHAYGGKAHRTTIVLPLDLYNQMKLITKHQNTSINSYIIKAVTYYIKNHPGDLPPPSSEKE